MSTLLATLGLAFVLLVIGFALLGLGWIIKGRSTLKAGSCGRAPSNKNSRDESCGTKKSCSLCDQPNEKKNSHGTIQKR